VVPSGEYIHPARVGRVCALPEPTHVQPVDHELIYRARWNEIASFVACRSAVATDGKQLGNKPVILSALRRRLRPTVTGLAPSALLSRGGLTFDVRFAPKSGHVRCNYRCPLWAKSGHPIDETTDAGRIGMMKSRSALRVNDRGSPKAKCFRSIAQRPMPRAICKSHPGTGTNRRS